MDKKQIEGQLKLSKKQNKNDRYEYLCSQFNCVEYAMRLEKYANKLIKENNYYKRLGFKYLNDKNIELQDKLDKIEKYIENNEYFDYDCNSYQLLNYENILQIIKGEDK